MITNKTSFLDFIKQHIVENVSMKHLRNSRSFISQGNKHYNVSLYINEEVFDIMLCQYRSGNVWCSVTRYVYDEYDDKSIIKQGTMTVDNNGYITYDSFHFDDIYIKSKQ